MKAHEFHPDITTERMIEAIADGLNTLTDYGYCVKCGAEHTNIEPDACDYAMGCCPESSVYGAQELLFMLD